ncbi:MAG: hypothetical protein R2941_22595 [Desulfobacterales bacterium]
MFGALVMSDDVDAMRKKGLTFSRRTVGGAMLFNRKNFRAKEFA